MLVRVSASQTTLLQYVTDVLVSGVGAELLPAGETITQPLYVRVEPSNQLQHAVLAVLHADIHDNESTLAESTVMGFVYM